MTGARVRAAQQARPAQGARLIRGTVQTVSPLTVTIGTGTNGTVTGLAVPGHTYAVGDQVLVTVQEPSVGPVYPLKPMGPTDLSAYAKTANVVPLTAFSALPQITNLDTAPDGFAFVPTANSGLDGAALVETFTANLSGTPWRLQRLESEKGGAIRTRSSYAGTWNAWTDPATSALLPTITNLDTAPDGRAFAASGATSNPFAASVLVETYTATLSGPATWRFQKASHESNGTTRTRRQYAGSWSAWAAASTA